MIKILISIFIFSVKYNKKEMGKKKGNHFKPLNSVAVNKYRGGNGFSNLFFQN